MALNPVPQPGTPENPARLVGSFPMPVPVSRQALIDSYEAKVQDFATETLRTSAALAACAERGERAPVHMGDNLGWTLAMEWVETCIRTANDCADRPGDHLHRCALPRDHEDIHDDGHGSRWGRDEPPRIARPTTEEADRG